MSSAPSATPGFTPWSVGWSFVLSFWLGIGRQDWAVIIGAIALVWTAEFLNTALEAVVDLASPQQHPLAKVGKDVGAAAVMIAAAGLCPDRSVDPWPTPAGEDLAAG